MMEQGELARIILRASEALVAEEIPQRREAWARFIHETQGVLRALKGDSVLPTVMRPDAVAESLLVIVRRADELTTMGPEQAREAFARMSDAARALLAEMGVKLPTPARGDIE